MEAMAAGAVAYSTMPAFALDAQNETAVNQSGCKPVEFVITEPPSFALPPPILYAFSVPATAIILLTIFGNTLVLCFKARVGRTNTTLLVWNLGLTDFMVGVLVLPMGAVHLITGKWIFGRLLCRIWVAADVTFCTCSVVTICVISADRYLAVTRPLRYKSLVTKVKVIAVMVMIWTFSSMILVTTVRWEHSSCVDDSICFAGNEIRYLAHSVVFAFFLPASVTLTLYWRIYRLARNRQRALDRGFLMILGHNMNFLTNTIAQNTTLRVHFGRNNGMVEHQRRVLRTHERIAKTLGVVSCSFLFCWLPFFVLYLTNYQCRGCIPTFIIDVASWLGYCNSMLNPIIYSFTVKEFKRSAMRAALPAWRLLFQIFPQCVPKPPDSVQRMNRNGQRVKAQGREPRRSGGKGRNDKWDGCGNGAAGQRPPGGPAGQRMATRRCTEPAVFALTRSSTAAKAPQRMRPHYEADENGFDLRHTIAEEGYHEQTDSSEENIEPLLMFEQSSFVNSLTTNTNANSFVTESRSAIGYHQAKISPTNSASGGAATENGTTPTGGVPRKLPPVAATASSSAWSWLAGGRYRRKAAQSSGADSDDQSPLTDKSPLQRAKTSNSLSGSWHSIKTAAQERARRWALSAHSRSVDASTATNRRPNKTGKAESARADAQRLLSTSPTVATALPVASIVKDATNAANKCDSQSSLRLYWNTPEADL